MLIQLIGVRRPYASSATARRGLLTNLLSIAAPGISAPTRASLAQWQFRIGHEIVYRDVSAAICVNDA
nr:hypothetical protein [Burkholderia pyrrocinia]